jgi:hypothetical protein
MCDMTGGAAWTWEHGFRSRANAYHGDGFEYVDVKITYPRAENCLYPGDADCWYPSDPPPRAPPPAWHAPYYIMDPDVWLPE